MLTIFHLRCSSESKNWKCFATNISRSYVRALPSSSPNRAMMIAMIEPVQTQSAC
jgi:hypothetical protein